jgi:lysophospholipase L1-like esterase
MVRSAIWFLAILGCASVNVRGASESNLLTTTKRILLLGDSITYSGEYVSYVEASLRTEFPEREFDIIDVGLPSETVSGLSEPGHAGGKFPRPDLHERLDRVLQKLNPDLVVAGYGINDGIYHPFSEERFVAFTNGIHRLREKVRASGATIIHLTPSVFDAVPLKGKTLPAGLKEYRQPYEGYDDVLSRYSDWLLSQRTNRWRVIDVHGPMKRYLETRRKHSPEFTLASDGVHPNATGHLIIAEQIIRWWKRPTGSSTNSITFTWRAPDARDAQAEKAGNELLALIRKRQKLLTDAWLTDTGHSRPGMTHGIPIAEANQQAKTLDQQIRSLSKSLSVEINAESGSSQSP